MDTITISYQRRVAARAGAQRFWLAAHIEALPSGHPVKCVVAFMALYARDVLRGELAGPYSDERALRFARLALTDPDAYAAHRTQTDHRLALALGLPVEEIAAVHRDQARLTAQACRQTSQDSAQPAPNEPQSRPSGRRGADVPAMTTIQIIELDGRPAGLVAGEQAIIAEHLSPRDRARVQAKALYALEIRAGARPGPYTDDGAERYAASAAARRHRAARRHPRSPSSG